MYELLFWKYEEGIYHNHHEVYEALCEQQFVDGLETIPTAVILNRIAGLFSEWERVDESSWKNNKGPGAFHVITSLQSIKIDCYGTEGRTMDVLTNSLEEFQCPLYDPQVPVRYDGVE